MRATTRTAALAQLMSYWTDLQRGKDSALVYKLEEADKMEDVVDLRNAVTWLTTYLPIRGSLLSLIDMDERREGCKERDKTTNTHPRYISTSLVSPALEPQTELLESI